jgi:hypothetical protein
MFHTDDTAPQVGTLSSRKLAWSDNNECILIVAYLDMSCESRLALMGRLWYKIGSRSVSV